MRSLTPSSKRPQSDTSPKVREGRDFDILILKRLTPRQRRFLEVKLAFPWPSYSKAARAAGYSESVCRKAARIIGGSPLVRRIIDEWRRREFGDQVRTHERNER